MFKALKAGSITRVIPVIGTLTPLFLLFYSKGLGNIDFDQAWAVGILIMGLIFITLTDWKGKIYRNEIFFELLSSLLFAFYYILLKQALIKTDFLSVLSYSRVIFIPFAILIFITP